MSAEIPTIDLTAAHPGDALMAAYTSVGFAQIVGHDVAPELVASAFAASRAFHALPLEQKMTVALDARHRGYIAVATSTDRASELGAATRPNRSESFIVMGDSPIDPAVYLSGPNQWPELAGFREALDAYTVGLEALSRRIIAPFAAALGIESTLTEAFVTPTTWLRLLHYPAREPGQDTATFGSAPHVDFGAITVVAQDAVGGLQVQTADGHWTDVAPVEGAFVVNTGEMLRRWSGNRIRATPHRVVNPPGIDRYSVAYFFDPHMTAVIEPLSGPIDGGPAIEPTRFDSYVRAQLEATYDRYGDD